VKGTTGSYTRLLQIGLNIFCSVILCSNIYTRGNIFCLVFQESSLTIDDVTFKVFSKVLIQIKVETSSSRNRFVNISLVQPSVGLNFYNYYMGMGHQASQALCLRYGKNFRQEKLCKFVS
jgi:hypothetical protein